MTSNANLWLEQLYNTTTNIPPVLPSSAAVGPEWAVCDVFDLNNVHLHAEAVSDPFIKLRCTHRTCISLTSPLILNSESSKKSFLLCRSPSFWISPIIRHRTRWEAITAFFCLFVSLLKLDEGNLSWNLPVFFLFSGHHDVERHKIAFVFSNVALSDVLCRRKRWKGRSRWTSWYCIKCGRRASQPQRMQKRGCSEATGMRTRTRTRTMTTPVWGRQKTMEMSTWIVQLRQGRAPEMQGLIWTTRSKG